MKSYGFPAIVIWVMVGTTILSSIAGLWNMLNPPPAPPTITEQLTPLLQNIPWYGWVFGAVAGLIILGIFARLLR